MPTNGQTVDNYKSVAEVFNKAAEVTKKSNVAFGYHNHDSEFEKDNGKVLQDVLLENTHPDAQYGLPAKIKVQIKFT